MEEMILKLESRAKSALYNPEAVTPEALEQAMSEALALTEEKPIPEPMKLDLAMFRLKMILKVEPSDLDQSLAETAIKAAQKMRTTEDGTFASATYIFEGRRSETW